MQSLVYTCPILAEPIQLLPGLLSRQDQSRSIMASWERTGDVQSYNCTAAGERSCAQYIADGQMHMRTLISNVVPAAEAPAMYGMPLNSRDKAMGVVLDWQE